MQGRSSVLSGTSGNSADHCSLCKREPPNISCSCKSPAILVCRSCCADHFCSSGTHQATPIAASQRPAECHRACDNCGISATVICCCQFPLKQLCDDCRPNHEAAEDKEHLIFPVKAAQFLPTADSIKKLRRRMTQVDLSREVLALIARRFDDAERDIVHTMDDVKVEAERSKIEKCKAVVDFRNNFEEEKQKALDEVHEHIYEDNYAPTSRLAREIFTYREENRESLLSIFHYKVDISKAIDGLHSAAEVNLTLHNAPSLSELKSYPNCVPVIASTSLRMFNVERKTHEVFTLLREPINISDSSSWMMLDSVTVFACGRMQPLSASVYKINVETGEIQHMKPMNVARYSQGLGINRRTQRIYVFGGTGGSPEAYLKSIEVYDIHEDQWRETTCSMKEGRDCFHPVLIEDRFYIIGGRNSRMIEVLSTSTETMSQFQFLLPYATSTTAVVDEGCILILQRDKIMKWKPGTTELKTAPIKDGSHMYSNCTPLRIGSQLWLLRCVNGSILNLDLAADLVKCMKTPLIY